MNTPEFIMFTGIPASGKSTYSRKLADMGYRVLSADVIRIEMAGAEDPFAMPQDEFEEFNAGVFDHIKHECATSLREGISVVMDATNIARKRRLTYLAEMNRVPCRKKCLLFITPLSICIERNSLRQDPARVPDSNMNKMLRNFECPCYAEGWDEIEIISHNAPYSFPFEDTVGFEQANPHHTRTLHAHLEAARSYAESHGFSPMLQKLAYYHDIGKLYTQSFKNAKGEPSESAHYYGHENYGTLLYLAEACCGRELSPDEIDAVLYEANLINCHMRPLNVWQGSDKRKKKDVRFFGEDFVGDLEKLHKADVASH